MVMAPINLDLPVLREGRNVQIVKHFYHLAQTNSILSICKSLFDAVDRELIPPQIFGIFTSWSRSFEVIALCITDGPATFIRKSGATEFGKALSHPEKWESAWKALGDTTGLVNLFAKISVTELKYLTRVIGRCNRGQRRSEKREKAVEILLQALLPYFYPGSKFSLTDKRPVQKLYAQMVTACSDAFLSALLDSKDGSNPLYSLLPTLPLLKSHPAMIQARLKESVFGSSTTVEDESIRRYFWTFMSTEPSKPSLQPRISASMEFAVKALLFRLKNIDDKRWPPTISEASVLLSVLHRARKRRLHESNMHDLIKLGMQLLETKPNLKGEFQSRNLWTDILVRYKRKSYMYEDVLVSALQLGLGGSETTLSRDFLKTALAIKATSETRWHLLRLYCLHVPKNGVDIFSSTDFKPIAKQSWPSDLFYYLEKDKAILLLNGLNQQYPKTEFLHAQSGSILSRRETLVPRSKFNVELLLTILQRPSNQAKVANAVDELRKQAASTKDQSERALLARAAADYSIASGDLEIYKETVLWLQRYVRDPLSIRTIFGGDAFTTTEGIDLLSAIPEPLPQDFGFVDIASRIETANSILILMHETTLIAKREPSYDENLWSGIATLFGSTIERRVTLAAELQKKLYVTDADLYAGIWKGTLDMLQRVGDRFIAAAQYQIQNLLSTLPPSSLQATTQFLLEDGKRRREKKDRQSGDDILERLSYEILLKLARCEKPDLARNLILQTILDRPDASSWHRQLLSVSFLNRLSAKDAQDMLLAFATAVGEKLEEQSYVRVGEAEPSKTAPLASLVKVTTVKYLAQLLDNASFISADAAVEVLIELFKAGTHKDIRFATLDSLLSMLNNICNGADGNWKSNPLTETILSALDTTVPIISSINESRPPQGAEWEAAKTGILPDVSNPRYGIPPLLNAILNAGTGVQYPALKPLKSVFYERFIVPAIKLSVTEHRKWLELFLVKHKAGFSAASIPSTPITADVWEVLVTKYPEFTPQAILELWDQYISFQIAPPVQLTTFNVSLKKNLDVANTPEVEHWLSIFDRSLPKYSQSGTHELVSLIHHNHVTPSQNGMSFEGVKKAIMGQVSLLLDHYDKHQDFWNNFVDDLKPPNVNTVLPPGVTTVSDMVFIWQQTGARLLDDVITLLQKKTTQKLANRGHHNLPPMDRLYLWKLKYPSSDPNPEKLDSEFQAFAANLIELIDEFLNDQSKVLRWSRVAKEVCSIDTIFNSGEERLCIASYLGKLVGRAPGLEGGRDQKTEAMNFVRMEVTIRLIQLGGLEGKANKKKIDKSSEMETDEIDMAKRVENAIRNILKEWRYDGDEMIRDRVIEFKKTNAGIWKILMNE